ncbi:bifunctional [glutamine synthetase] adenylyltransferase/[glutamine synthetase]-adenylyl-L-tyrosine phosphorylase [Gluconacetobacter entanii]|uniref:Bifunctional [glutamine synthetase] adenylyltransferase/[glutamine synthetase]-adenylyl-L-tyrosine phosphorylase n=1 Tax=Gluconacetobacter entanii TaxID=108528 RepID=A0ABT3K6F1_9PROT|nr:bifunctional [glutamine synthetase] adenylyltransferase/[glutamine synthetase]-adenylyl-L-tyrosine phosphorylase [Gluconacetobacter entanii]MCW4590990.1 bifunctional [glutamine synthetase] adenylyltransferase/[glutamine synthetase]-adenylyl-L-tyrosine phosphorylase [Gluconacetobacter entanii]MCW4594483.1 bifunctional [glutamine synthetase] adenylyltransferase/[glutamine synthetase]-adenylyl-L-tyrosine phosphorylase [Gluconacetobacter entanii]NPC89558.1 bifunctional [glutamine synthetase] aden
MSHPPAAPDLHRGWRACTWPAPADARGAALLHEDMERAFGEHGLDAAWLAMPPVAAMVAAMGGNSPYLSDLARRDTDLFARLLREGPDSVMRATLSDVRAESPRQSRHAIAHALRTAKRHAALTIALADIGGAWSLQQVTHALSHLAETTLQVAVRHLLRTAHDAGRLVLPDPDEPARGSGFVVLAMGKLGARELNYSSDIDLIVLYDPACHPEHEDLRRIFVRMTSDLVGLMEARDADGYVFRTDLRLRPDPSATPLAVSFPTAITYYESMGRTWERAAMIKARPVAGDIAAGQRFLAAIHPFVWRRHLDFAVIDDIHDMKARIDRHRNAGRGGLPDVAGGTPACALAMRDWLLGHDVKLGQGGIREVEFVAQALQLVWGGRRPDLRDPTTLGALRRLTQADLITHAQYTILSRNYHMMRQVEHRLQMRADHQTHKLPETADRFAQFAIFMNEADGPALARAMLPTMQESRRIFEQQFSEPGRPDETIAPEDAELGERLEQAGFAAATLDDARAILQRWDTNRLRALRSDRARMLLRRLLPGILREIGARRDPLTVLRRFDSLLERQWAGVQFLSLLERNPALVHRIMTVLDGSAFLANHLAQAPSALDGLLDASMIESTDDTARAAVALVRQHVAQAVAQAAGPERLLPVLRGLVCGEEFRLSVARLEHRMTEDRTARVRTAMADAVMRGLLRTVTTEHRARHGHVPGGAMAVVAMGKAGSREMMPGSDLDLMLVFDHPDDVVESVVPHTRRAGMPAARPLGAGTYFVRLAHAFIATLTAPGAEGPLYEADMRLRPSGSKGPVAVSLSSFRRYHAESAWTWERMALTRARIVAGPPELARRLRAAIDAALDGEPGTGRAMTPEALREDVRAMRARLMRDLPPQGPWDIKRRAGGLMEVEFIAQGLQLLAARPAARSPCTRVAFTRLARAGMLSAADARMLRRADLFWRSAQGMLRILMGTEIPDHLPPAAQEIMMRELDARDGADMLARMDDMARHVRDAFCRLIAPLPAIGDTRGEA